jgi:hypothetical protein
MCVYIHTHHTFSYTQTYGGASDETAYCVIEHSDTGLVIAAQTERCVCVNVCMRVCVCGGSGKEV